MTYRYGNVPDAYVRDTGTLTLLPNVPLTIVDGGTGVPVAGLLYADGTPVPSGTQVRTDANGEYAFGCDSPSIMLSTTSPARTWGPIVSPDVNAAVVATLVQAGVLAASAAAAATSAATSAAAAVAAQTAAETAAASGGGSSGVDGSTNATITGAWTFATAPVVPDPTAAKNPATKSYADALGQSAAAANSIVRRDAAGRFQAATPAAAADVVNKSYADALGTETVAPNTLPRRKATGSAVEVGTPTVDADAVNLAYAASHILTLPTVDATGGSTVPAGLPVGTLVMRLATPDPAPAWTATAETSSGQVPLSWTVPTSAVPGQTVIVVSSMAVATGVWTPPAGTTLLYSSTQGAGMTTMIHAFQVSASDIGTTRQVTASTIAAGTRAKVVALAYDGSLLTGLAQTSLTVQGTATTTPTVPGVAATGPGIVVNVLVGRLTGTITDGQHWTWPSGAVEQYDDAVATTSSVSTVSVTAASTIVTAAASAASRAPTTDLAAVQYVAASIWLPAAVDSSSSGGSGGTGGSAGAGAGTDEWLRWYGRDPEAMATGVIDRVASGCPVGFSVAWPFGTGTGTCVQVPSSVDARQADSWTVTYVPAGGGTTKTVTQPTMTRDPATGGVTVRPTLTVS